MAKFCGLEEVKAKMKGQPLFTDGKRFYAYEVDGHNGGLGKVADDVRSLGSKYDPRFYGGPGGAGRRSAGSTTVTRPVRSRAKPGAPRAPYLVRSVVGSGLICAWGDDEDTAMMEDSEGRVMVPVWPHPEFAIRGLAIFPVDDRIAVTWAPREFAAKIRAERARTP
ncbi:DUF2750 domain-containing protein [Amycolatopsis sp. H6(2020)]|nr:DUF2750 domain-containing protein [Amycolatopsis sp. H6(2020)]